MGRRKFSYIAGFSLLIFALIICEAHGSRTIQDYKLKTKHPKQKSFSPHRFTGCLPKGTQVPPSGPSKEHNSLGPQKLATYFSP
ncbi:hypothetical protein ACJRO7_024611 [Eucalyptus globulus]|uniref:Uncharacterized protein n=1 Tax=Eucalyptus globulus TaxID=34317 RepID=A0ABD3K633_EUCGL